ncbi:hypothetical protein A3B21_00275 [Candidatus Uhrbacteria bacterium RIFCSPLOWO2_01_FULL_47_24]|uniref:NadR/Ttd14 AAA domain-containing protein n=1 Tax=Candidatus Uhrbacteria bacterium RIFCSPLOWO2_01_FULL_47_24 TaxID=1802401 RepID=A0A1F7UUK7_9BACT|nr:MAG: hypothetical protein A2753_03905 [Candidatus Uhrbacteria bacterium RIFCSPHIGHO2_01_FULL_47_11]OGL69031.1 MAG: hypothetical protein A3D58_00225 [Candidatus Uhrbacteria bacterium RIFCSPHIGHO2_02_FULL_46_47]OGL76313.1 MAG: hypothetical protein A3F52_00975 [Candidatus Uhrbacteria bacterium RIFCSPHIGHO2_12_FULL_47_11]OGL81347.1 MAG: hypothetical protein A3B21_00275 [Candidatus Uhrbacteria bacterium RIFCSPLOWO2_01_FULL_47_24]OGL83781.1 MAG: hypothetical protein A3J03_02635 [Candidatus Uhrbact
MKKVKKSQAMTKIPRIVFTGGPCAGKTTTINYVGKKLKELGFHCVLPAEVSAILIDAALLPNKIRPLRYGPFERAYVKTQLFWESIFDKMAQEAEGDKKIIIFDRGVIDLAAYMPVPEFNAIIKKHGWNFEELRDSYDLVVHMVTAAEGAEKFYNLDMPARYAGLEEARWNEKNLRAIWQGHPNIRIIENPASFEQKMKHAFEAVCSFLKLAYPS